MTAHLTRNQTPRPALPPTKRQREVLALVAAGQHNRAIAARLGISPDTVRGLLADCYRRLGIAGQEGVKAGGARTLAAIWWERTRQRERQRRMRGGNEGAADGDTAG